jgi:F-type H+-transporting ATPase subunit epsilon
MAFTVNLITPERALPEMQADHVTAIAIDGQVGIRTGHAPLVALLKDESYIIVRTFGVADFKAYAVRGGVAQMLENRLKILTPTAVDLSAIDSAQVRKRADAEKDPSQKAWLEHQLQVLAANPFPAGRV